MIVILRGAAGVGKTSTLRLVCQKCMDNGYQPIKSNFLSRTNSSDFTATLQKNDKKIGIASSGDRFITIIKTLSNFIDKGCAVVVIAARNNFKSINSIPSLDLSNHEIIYVDKTPRNAQTNEQVNQYDANIIYNTFSKSV